MKTLEITLPDQLHERFQLAAQKLGLTIEELIQITVEEKLEKAEPRFQEATKHVLKKNEELYRRLA